MQIISTSRSGITCIAVCDTPGIEPGSAAEEVLLEFDRLFLNEGQVYAGSIDEFLRLVCSRVPPETVYAAFDQLEEAGWIIVTGNLFYPTSLLVRRYG